jgi:hypothetical protein
MSRTHSFFTASFLACSFAVLGCGEGEGPVDHTPSDLEYKDVARSFGAVISANGQSGEVSAMSDANDLAIGVVPFGLTLSASGEFNGNRLGVDYSYDVSCKDAQGNAMSVCNSETDSANVNVAWSGELSAPPTIVAMADRSGMWHLTNIQSGVALFNGDSSFEFDSTVMNDGVTTDYHFSYSGSYEDVRIQRNPHKILGGTIRYDISADHRVSGLDGGNSASAFDIDAVLTFDGEGHAKIVLDGTHTYDLDLASGNVTVHAEAGN